MINITKSVQHDKAQGINLISGSLSQVTNCKNRYRHPLKGKIILLCTTIKALLCSSYKTQCSHHSPVAWRLPPDPLRSSHFQNPASQLSTQEMVSTLAVTFKQGFIKRYFNWFAHIRTIEFHMTYYPLYFWYCPIGLIAASYDLET